MRTIVFARNIEMGSPIRTNTHNYAIQFHQAGWNTIWLPKPVAPWNVFRLGCLPPRAMGIRQYRLFFLLTYGGRKVNSMKRLWDVFPHTLVWPRRHKLRSEGLLEPDVFFAGSLETASLYKLLRAKKFVYNAHDAFSLYPGAPRSLGAIEAEILLKADLTVTTAETTRELLMDRYGVPSERVLNLGHGVDNLRYAAVTEPARLQAIPRPRAVCLGTLDMQDIGLTVRAVGALPRVHFLFIGPGGRALRNRLEQAGAANAHFLGPISQDALPDYLAHCDVGLIGYDRRLKDSRLYGTNPMKRYDYAAAGLQTVSVELMEYRKTPSPMYVAGTAEEYIGCIQEAIATPRYTATHIRQFALANDWRSKYETLLSRLHGA